MTASHAASQRDLATRSLTAPDAVDAWIDGNVRPLPGEEIETADGDGRTLDAAAIAAVDVPAKALAACDGFALSASSTIGASAYNPLPLRLAADGPGPDPASLAWPVDSGMALPDGVDAVLPLDRADLAGPTLEVTEAVASGEHVLAVGREALAGHVVVAAGRRLRPQDLALLAAAGLSRVRVVRRPRARIVCVRGRDEDRAGPMVAALLRRDGCGPCTLEHAGGDAGRLSALLAAGDCDVVVGIGGTGPGRNDHAVDTLAALGEVIHHGIAVHPGGSSAIGRLGTTPVVLLPGPPLAAFIAADLFACRVLRRLGGRSGDWPYPVRTGVLTRKIASRLGRLEICRVRVDGSDVEPIAVADGTTLATAVRADGFVPVPLNSEGFAAGATVTVRLYHPIP